MALTDKSPQSGVEESGGRAPLGGLASLFQALSAMPGEPVPLDTVRRVAATLEILGGPPFEPAVSRVH